MKKIFLKFLKIFLPLGIGIFLIWYSLKDLSATDRQQLWQQIITANPWWLALSIIIALLSHLSRAYRWQFLIKPLGFEPRLQVSFAALMVGYVANLGIPRSGEVLRAATLSNYDNIPMQKVIGTVITERIIDFIMLLLIVALAFLFNTTVLVNYLEQQQIKPLNLILIVLGLCALLGLGYVILNKIESKFLSKIKKFITEMYEGVGSIFKMKQKIPFLFHTLFIWGAYILMFFVIKFCIPATQDLSPSAILMAFVAGAFAISTTNGGIGAYPIAIGLVLVLFNLNKTDGEAYGWIIWGSQTIMNIIVGGLAFLYISVFLKKK